MRCSTNESSYYRYTLDGQRMSQDAIVVREMFNGRVEMLSGVEMLSLYMICSTDVSRCYCYTLDVQRMSRDAIVVHEICRPDPPSPLLLPFRAAENYLNHLAAAAAATVPTHLACRNRKRFPQVQQFPPNVEMPKSSSQFLSCVDDEIITTCLLVHTFSRS
ncbi:hypothetical protein Tco_0714018 [Tanacetum coccineum]